MFDGVCMCVCVCVCACARACACARVCIGLLAKRLVTFSATCINVYPGSAAQNKLQRYNNNNNIIFSYNSRYGIRSNTGEAGGRLYYWKKPM